MSKFKLPYLLICFSLNCILFAQNSHLENLTTLDKLLRDENLIEAQAELNQNINDLKLKKSYFLLTDYIYYTGKINLELQNPATATNAVNTFVKSIFSLTDSITVLRQVKLELASFYELIGNSQKAYDSNLDALELTAKWKGATPEDYGLIENNLGTLANRKGDLVLGLKHHRKALKQYESYSKTNKKNLYIIYNSLGGSMWYVSKIDSALYYYQKAEKILKYMEAIPMNSYYRPAILNNNIAGIHGSQGNVEKALENMKKTISFLNQFIEAEASDALKESATEFLFQAIENYAGIYKDMGDFENAKELIEYSYKEKQKHFDAANPELYKAKILLGQIYLSLKNYKLSEFYLDSGIAHIKKIDIGNNYWSADAHYYKAILSDELGKIDTATYYYNEAERLYENALDGAYDELYLDFIINASHFYAANQQKERALTISKKAYDYVLKNQGSTTSFEIQQSLNLGEIYYELGDYTAALEKAFSTEKLLKKSLPTQTNSSDSINIILYKPQTILLRSQSAYKLQNQKDVSFLKKEFKELKEAISILGSQKTFIGDDNNVAFLIEKNAKIFEFAKQLALELYNATKDKTYVNEFLSLHESIIYNRIRARLDSKTSMAYSDLPTEVFEEEKKIKKSLKNALTATDNIDGFIIANTQWNSYLKRLEKNYPKYYKMRFATITKSLKDIEQKLPNETTVVRYIYTTDQLYAILISKNDTRLFKIDQAEVKEQILKLLDDKNFFENNFNILNNLYLKLWQPFENEIKTDHVVIIPDRDLFNLNFEMLTDKVVKSNKELATNSLLRKNTISYNYSLFLIDNDSKQIGYNDNFVAFVPEFNDKMKSDYKISIKDSLSLDKTYLTLLQQPFSRDLAQYATQLFSGSSFLNEKASKQIFTNEAKEHKIIHIGTHAESNNVSPELSRLVFAKSLDSKNNNHNYLYAYEIYNTNLSSNLAILTACETGKPTYQAGEGMISLAHAFNYAGSGSILTSLWKIDEQSSAKIVELFYKNIKKGWSKDKALQQAKLDYLVKAEGRAMHPKYWAGLVLIGDVAPIELKLSFNIIYWVFGILLIVFMVILFKKIYSNY
tara:strand:- start:428 stop:3655 length:3228 start_codon:yes stop_codon:yes gene_type:complete